jgi:CheY-like chemotaxis protein
VKVHVIVSDLSMPGMDGHELLRRTRQLPSQAGRPTPAIALTAYDSAEHRRRAIDAGFDAYLARPLDPDALVRAIARLVSAREAP